MMAAAKVDSWEESTVAGEFYVQLGKRLDAAVNRGELLPCINNRAVRWGHIQVSESVMAPLTKTDIRDLRLEDGDILVCEGGEIGRASVWSSELPEAYFLNTLHRLRSKGRFEPRLLVAFFERLAATGEFLALVGKSSIAHLTKENLQRVRIPLPAKAEQERMAEALLAVDKLAFELERLIAKKHAIKQGMMQQLLTGRTRLPGFTESWVPLRVASKSALKARIGWQGLTASEYRATGIYRLVGGTEFSNGAVDWGATPFVNKWRYDQDASIQLQQGDILLTKDGTIGKTAYVDRLPGPATLNSGVFVIRPIRNSYDSRFLYFMLRSRVFGEFLDRLSAGSTISHLYQRDLVSLVLDAPPTIKEQQAISGALADVDRELHGLYARSVKAREIKQAMIQQLLTGRTRLPIREPTS